MPKWTNEQKKEKTRKRIWTATDPDRYKYTPAKNHDNYPKTDEYQRVGIYARVSTLNPEQTSSYELQQKYYEELVSRYPKWELVKIYADEGKSGVTIQHREAFNEMMADAYAGKLDLIIVKNISRLARNVIDFLSTVRKLAERKVGILFESEAIFSLNSDSHLALSFQATVAEEESRIRSRSMETSLRMRLDHGLPLTPELLGFMHNEDGKLVPNPETCQIPKLMFSMCLFGYSLEMIAEILMKLNKKTYLGNAKWTASGVRKSLQNERYCGDVITRKRFSKFPADVVDQKTFKNRGEKPQSHYMDWHDPIVSRDDFIAVQHILHNTKYGGQSFLPELCVIPEGLLKGFVVVHPRWGSFSKDDYIQASQSVDMPNLSEPVTITEDEGAFDLREYEVADFKLFDDREVPAITLQKDEIKFNVSCIRNMKCENYIELLVHPAKKKIAVRPTTKENKYAIQWAKDKLNNKEPRSISCKAYIDILYEIFGWPSNYKYKLYGCIYRDGHDSACIFSNMDASVFINKDEVGEDVDMTGILLDRTGKRIRAVTGNLGNSFGNEYYVEQSLNEKSYMTKEKWQTRMDGLLCHTDSDLKITPYQDLKDFIQKELGDLFEEVSI